MTVLSLPLEILQSIVQELKSEKDILAFSMTRKVLYRLLIDSVYIHNGVTSNGSALLWAIEHGQEDVARGYLNSGANIQVRRKKETPLVLAARKGHINIVQMLLDAGVNDSGKALEVAMSSGHDEIALLLFTTFPKVRAITRRMEDSFRIAASTGCLGLVQALLSQDVDINAYGIDYETALHLASANGHVNVVKLLLENGADVNFEGGEFGYALKAASDRGHIEVAEILLQHGADANKMCRIYTLGERYGSALGAASANGHDAIFELLLNHIHNPIDTRSFGIALCQASARGNFGAVQTLLNRQRDINASGENFQNAFHAACSTNQADMARFLILQGADMTIMANGDKSMLLLAVESNHKDIIRLLLEHGFGASDRTMNQGDNSQPLLGSDVEIAKDHGYAKSEDRLLHSNAHLEDRLTDHTLNSSMADLRLQAFEKAPPSYVIDLQTQCTEALRLAASLARPGIIEILLDRVDYTKEELEIAMFAAADHGSRASIRMFLDRGADINVLSEYSEPILARASYRGHVMTVEFLLQQGADPNIKIEGWGSILQKLACTNATGFSSSQQASRLEARLVKIFQLLLDHGAEVQDKHGEFGSALRCAVLNLSIGKVELLIEHNADVNERGEEAETILQSASFRARLEHVVPLLIDHGAELNAQGGEYCTALQAAAASTRLYSYFKTVKVLLEKGADVNIQGGRFGNALQAACARGPRGLGGDTQAVVELLIDHGANINAQGGEFGTALQAAISEHTGIGIIKLLLEKGADVNIQGGKHGNALQAAIHSGSQRTIELIQSHIATIRPQAR